MNRENFRFKIVMTFFESPNFNLTSDGETVTLAMCATKEIAAMLAEAYALKILQEVEYGPDLNDFSECNGDYTADFDGDDFCVIRWDKYIANIINIVEICPNCGCDPSAEPYCLAPRTHCPQCGHVFANTKITRFDPLNAYDVPVIIRHPEDTKPTKVVIVVEGGMVSSVHSSDPSVEVEIEDLDSDCEIIEPSDKEGLYCITE